MYQNAKSKKKSPAGGEASADKTKKTKKKGGAKPGADYNTGAEALRPKEGAGGGNANANAFYGEGFTYGDASKLAKFWKVSPDTAADRGGYKILNGMYIQLEHALNASDKGAAGADAASNESAEFYNQGYTLSDAKALAKFWKTTPEKAAERAGDMMLTGRFIEIEHAFNAIDQGKG